MTNPEIEYKESYNPVSSEILDHITKTEELNKNLSKKTIKKILKKQKWEETKIKRRQYKKERTKIKKTERRKRLEETGVIPVKLKKNQIPSDINVIIDCEFDDKMIDKEIISLSSQLTRCYSDNRKSSYPLQLYVTSFGGRLAERMRTVLKNQHIAWQGIQFLDHNYIILSEKNGFKKEDFIYLTADSENTIYELNKNKIYIVGGLIDKNRYKNLCLDKARSQGIYTAQLPIEDYIKMKSRKVLTINQVLEIMHNWIEIKDWEKAFLNVIPSRKLPQSKKIDNFDKLPKDFKTDSLMNENIEDLLENSIEKINE
ncbi:hypothetical protein PCANB_002533 [Pneumocystis canis]|nr:hypothetical protein PCK1_002545 [Pneumocystis canis]KAG5438813.1 hypothetical protein PCANB_002533 [Pneumocystis canis]